MTYKGFEIKRSGKMFKATYPDGRPLTMRYFTMDSIKAAIDDVLSRVVAVKPKTCDCPIVFPENLHMCGQVHKYDCPLAPKGSLNLQAETTLAMVARLDQILFG